MFYQGFQLILIHTKVKEPLGGKRLSSSSRLVQSGNLGDKHSLWCPALWSLQFLDFLSSNDSPFHISPLGWSLHLAAPELCQTEKFLHVWSLKTSYPCITVSLSLYSLCFSWMVTNSPVVSCRQEEASPLFWWVQNFILNLPPQAPGSRSNVKCRLLGYPTDYLITSGSRLTTLFSKTCSLFHLLYCGADAQNEFIFKDPGQIHN